VKRSTLVAVAALATGAVSGRLAAQSAEQPNLILSITGGLTTGGDLWTLPRQIENAPGGARDTLTLGRRLRPGIVAVLGATYFRSPHLGYVAEFGFFGVASEGRCTPVGPYAPDPDNLNQKACTTTEGAHYPTSIIGFQAGLAYRVLARGPVSPYVRLTAGIGALGNSYVQTLATVVADACAPRAVCTVGLLDEPRRRGATWVGTLAAGATWSVGTGYQARIEVRDFVAGVPIAADSTTPNSSNPFPVAKPGTRTRHILTLTAGFDLILERRHRRRY
jgi:hypothetical protein